MHFAAQLKCVLVWTQPNLSLSGSATIFPRPNADFPHTHLNPKFLKVWVSSHLSNLSISLGSSQSLETRKSLTLANNNIFQMRD